MDKIKEMLVILWWLVDNGLICEWANQDLHDYVGEDPLFISEGQISLKILVIIKTQKYSNTTGTFANAD